MIEKKKTFTYYYIVLFINKYLRLAKKQNKEKERLEENSRNSAELRNYTYPFKQALGNSHSHFIHS